MAQCTTEKLTRLDHAHVWHPFTPMRQWREHFPVVIERGKGFELIDTDGRRYIDATSSIWANVHGHQVPHIDQAIRDQLEKIAHTTLLGLASPPSIELARRLCRITPGQLNKVFYSDSGATALELAFKMAVGYWHHSGRPEKNRFIGLSDAYHGDTTGSMSVGYSQLFHRPFLSMVFDVSSFPSPNCAARVKAGEGLSGSEIEGLRDWSRLEPSAPQPLNPEATSPWPSENQALGNTMKDHSLKHLEQLLQAQGDQTAAVVIEPIMQGAGGMVPQPPGFVREVARLAEEYDTLLIGDEVATGFGRTGRMFACEHETDEQFTGPDIMCLAKGLTGGYLPLAATLCSDRIERAFTGEIGERKTLYHGHTYTGNALACAAALANLDLFDWYPNPSPTPGEGNQADRPSDTEPPLIAHTRDNAQRIHDRLQDLHESPHVLDVRQRGLMIGIELCEDRFAPTGPKLFDFTQRIAHQLCDHMRTPNSPNFPHRSDLTPTIARPIGDVIMLMPAPAMPRQTLDQMLDTVTQTVLDRRLVEHLA